jgi:mRNA interferase RelE/StbE
VTNHRAADYLDRLEKSQPKQFQRIDDALFRLALTRYSTSIKALKGETDIYRLRVGDYRVVFHFDHAEEKLYVIAVDHSKDVYRP